VKIIAIGCHASELAPGDLFSSVGPEFWDQAHTGVSVDPETQQMRSGAIGVKVYIRTEVPFDPTYQTGADRPVYRLHIVPTVIEDLTDDIKEVLSHDDDDLEPE
jgi:hypothetical protein